MSQDYLRPIRRTVSKCKNVECWKFRREKSAYCQSCSDKHNGIDNNEELDYKIISQDQEESNETIWEDSDN